MIRTLKTNYLGVLSLLVYKDKKIKIYTTNNLLLVLKGESIVKEVYIEDKCLIDDMIAEYKEKHLEFINLKLSKISR